MGSIGQRLVFHSLARNTLGPCRSNDQRRMLAELERTGRRFQFFGLGEWEEERPVSNLEHPEKALAGPLT